MIDFAEKFRTRIGDEAKNVPDNLIIEVFNAALQKATSVPQLSRAFRKHYIVELNAKDGYKWKLEGDFRRLADIPLLNFFSTEKGGDPCPLKICPLNEIAFYNKHGLPSLKKAGIPCEYTLEQQDDDTWLVLDRPSDVPIVIDYIAYGYPAPVYDMEHPKLDKHGKVVKDKQGNIIIEQTEIEISAVIEQIILDSMTEAFYREAEDLAFAGAVLDIMSNKYIPEALQALYHTFGSMPPAILGEP